MPRGDPAAIGGRRCWARASVGLAVEDGPGPIDAEVRRTFPLERAADAHRDVETGHGRGKVVLLVG
ncbi:zinc-binding dehydrogenase [Pseudofrankia sp. BMG5.37]|nr:MULTISPECIES: zinc-binding dehydrogenase [unclassified Pseudofrankia]MDT3438056.1 zinc-binding dehydrogenase [Pseudofrankia sp. BMG5.37]OHV56781.1 hypothetical protein BCD48_06850 [Pseudofrankia sp. BMG5.36]